jgi:AAA family ATP:ADP antiporter
LQITTVEEAKEFYPLFGLGANVALIFSGRTVKYFSNMRKNLGPGVDGWAISLKAMMSIVGLVITGIYWGVNKFVIDNSSMPVVERKKKVGPDKFSTILLLVFMDLSLTILQT